MMTPRNCSVLAGTGSPDAGPNQIFSMYNLLSFCDYKVKCMGCSTQNLFFFRSFSGYFLLCCSWDGSVAYVEFTDEELGNTLSQEEKVCFV